MNSNPVNDIVRVAKALSKRSDFPNKLLVRKISEKCSLNIKIEDEFWDYDQDTWPLKTSELHQTLYKDLSIAFNTRASTNYSPEEFEEKFRSVLILTQTEGCLHLSLDMDAAVQLVFDSYRDILSSSKVSWNNAISGSLFALAAILQGSREWISLNPILLLKKEYKEDEQILKSLSYAHKILASSRSTPNFLASTLSPGAQVSINSEPAVTGKELDELRYASDEVEVYFVDGEYKIKSFSSKSIRVKLGPSDKMLSLKFLEEEDRKLMGALADTTVAEEESVSENLRISVEFKGCDYHCAWVAGIGDRREGSVDANELFANPLYALPALQARSIKEKEEPDRYSLLDYCKKKD